MKATHTIKITTGLDPDSNNYIREYEVVSEDGTEADYEYQRRCVSAAETLAMEPGVIKIEMRIGKRLACKTKIETKWYH